MGAIWGDLTDKGTAWGNLIEKVMGFQGYKDTGAATTGSKSLLSDLGTTSLNVQNSLMKDLGVVPFTTTGSPIAAASETTTTAAPDISTQLGSTATSVAPTSFDIMNPNVASNNTGVNLTTTPATATTDMNSLLNNILQGIVSDGVLSKIRKTA